MKIKILESAIVKAGTTKAGKPVAILSFKGKNVETNEVVEASVFTNYEKDLKDTIAAHIAPYAYSGRVITFDAKKETKEVKNNIQYHNVVGRITNLGNEGEVKGMAQSRLAMFGQVK